MDHFIFLIATMLHIIISLYLKIQYILKARFIVNKSEHKSIFHMSYLFQWEEADFLQD